MSSQEQILQRIVEELVRVPSVERVILFGSRARGDARSSSDIDLCVVAPGAGRAEWVEIWSIVDEAETLRSIDLVRYESAAPALRERIAAEGRTLYERRPAA